MLPLIDVVFLLLVFFIYAMVSMVVHRGLKIELPQANTAELNQDAYISITIDAENQLYLNAEPIKIEGLAQQVKVLRGDSKKPVFIDGDKQADLGIAITLLDDLKKAGIEEVSFSCSSENP